MNDPTLTQDAFLGGRLTVRQPKTGYRAGIDPVLLAASVDAHPGQSVLELGCGVGVASLCLATRVPGLSVTGVELQPAYADLARRNATENHLSVDVITADLTQLPPDLKARRFDHVIANPPYFDRQGGPAARDAGREAALGEATPLGSWIDVATRRLNDGGGLTLIQRIERLPDILTAADQRLGSLIVCPISPRPRRAPMLFLLRATKGGKAGFRLRPPLVLHSGAAHTEGPKDYAPQVASVLAHGAALAAFSD
jgi:tRNA1Val (adenine37-N6)-methyltransferase